MTNKHFTSAPDAGTSGALFARACLRLLLLLAFLSPTVAMAWQPAWLGATSSGGDGYTLAHSIKVAPNNDHYVTGEFSSTAKFSSTTLKSRGGSDIFLAKYTASGSLAWIVTAGGTSDDVGRGVDLDSDGNVYITGWFTNSGTFDSVNQTTKTVSGTGDVIFLAKYSSAGNLAWVQTGTITDSSLESFGYGIAVNSAAHTVYITALSQTDTTFSSENGIVNTVPGVGTWHMVVVKYDTGGNFKWAQTNEASPNSVPSKIAVDVNGNAYVTGSLEDTTTFTSANGKDITVTGFSPAQTTGDYPIDAFLAKYDTNGNAVWVNHIGGYIATGSDVAVSPSGEVTLVGYVGNVNSSGEAITTVTSQLPRKNYYLIDAFMTDPYNKDLLIVTYTAAGVLETAYRIGHGGDEAASGVAYDSNGDLYVTGIARQTPTIRANLFIRKYHGPTLLWEQKAGSSALWVPGGATTAVSVGQTGAIYLAGGFQTWARFGPSTLTGHGSADMFVAQLASE